MVDYSIKRYSAYSDADLLARAREFATASGQAFVSLAKFSLATGISESTILNHFGTWAAFCRAAGLSPRYDRSAGREDLLRNLDGVWEAFGRQPRAKEMKQPLSPISVSRYSKVFGKSWYAICLEYLSWKSGTPVEEIESEAVRPSTRPAFGKRNAPRGISLSLRYEVLKRDRFRCVKCGRSPATAPGVQLHVDHVLAWANGGLTTLDNLQSLCSDCNLGKSHRHDG